MLQNRLRIMAIWLDCQYWQFPNGIAAFHQGLFTLSQGIDDHCEVEAGDEHEIDLVEAAEDLAKGLEPVAHPYCRDLHAESRVGGGIALPPPVQHWAVISPHPRPTTWWLTAQWHTIERNIRWE